MHPTFDNVNLPVMIVMITILITFGGLYYMRLVFRVYFEEKHRHYKQMMEENLSDSRPN